MKIILAAIALAIAVGSTAPPASAAYVSPEASWQTKSMSNGY